MPKVFVSRLIPEVGLRRIHAACDAEIWPHQLPPSPEQLREKIADCDGLLALLTDRLDAATLDAAPKLRVISNFAVGFNNIDVPAATARGIAVGNTPGVLTDATADLAFALLIAAARCMRQGHEHVVGGQWKTWEPLGYLGQELTGKTLGIVGLGRIGAGLAKRCRGGWDMNVLYTNPRRNEAAERELGASYVDFDTMLRESDFVSLHCPLTADNRHLMGRAQFQKMKCSAVFVNTARGPLVDQAALLEALKDGTIFAAGIDVTDPEPPRPDDPLLFQPNLIIAPHIASATLATRSKMAEMAADNLLAGVAGRPLPNWVNPEVASARRQE